MKYGQFIILYTHKMKMKKKKSKKILEAISELAAIKL